MDGGTDVMPQDLDDVCQDRHATLIQIGKKFILIFLQARRSGFNVGQVYIILLKERSRRAEGPVSGINTDKTCKTEQNTQHDTTQREEEQDFCYTRWSRSKSFK